MNALIARNAFIGHSYIYRGIDVLRSLLTGEDWQVCEKRVSDARRIGSAPDQRRVDKTARSERQAEA